MPLTDEIKQILGDKADENALLEMLEPEASKYLETKGHIIRTKDQDESYINTQVEERIKPKISELHKKYDEDFFEILGERKAPNEKTYEFAKRKLAELKESAAGKGGDQVLQDKIKQMEISMNEMKANHATELSSIKQKAFQSSLDSKISSFLDSTNIAIPAHLTTDEEKNAFVANQKRMLKADFISTFTAKEDENGNLVFYKGETLQASNKDGKPLTASEIIAANYSTYFAKQQNPKGGAGSGQGGNPDKGFATRSEVYEYLKEQGLDENSKEFNDKAVEFIRKYGLTK
jgi:hypothetical protein